MITPHLQHIATSLYTKRWALIANYPKRDRYLNHKKLGLIVFNIKENSIHFYPEEGARLSADDLQTIFVLMNNALAEQTKLSIN